MQLFDGLGLTKEVKLKVHEDLLKHSVRNKDDILLCVIRKLLVHVVVFAGVVVKYWKI